MDANVSTMTMPKTMPAQNLLRYISFKSLGLLQICKSGLFNSLFVSDVDSADVIGQLTNMSQAVCIVSCQG